MQLLFELTAKDVCIDKSCQVGQIIAEFHLSSVLEASKALTHSPLRPWVMSEVKAALRRIPEL